jgi:FkbH-like protein
VTAGSVVEESIPPGAVAGGTPARVLRGPSGKHESPKAPRAVDVHGILVADFTATELARELEHPSDALGPAIAAEVAPFDQVVQALLDEQQAQRDFMLVWTRPDRVSPAFARLLAGEPAPRAELLAEVDAFADLLLAAKRARFTFVATWTVPRFQRGAGMLDLREGGIGRALVDMNARLAARLDGAPSTFLLDANRWTACAAYNPRLWYLGKVGFPREVFAEAAADVRAALRGLLGRARKLLVVDLDDTVWGGAVGDVGVEGLRLGGHDAEGEALVDFQRALLALSRRGVALAVASKNEEDVALAAMRSHPEMVLKPEHLAGWRINRDDKAHNVADLARELHVGLDAVVFIDDSQVERARVRDALPDVLVPEWPADKTRYVEALHGLRCFDAPHVSAEDQNRTALFATERARSELRAASSSLDAWLDGLGTVVRFARLDPRYAARATQLLNKTNQMNLRTRRLSESELAEWAHEPAHELWVAHVSDKLGDAGLTGILGIEVARDVASLADFVLSCRVMGRRVEETLVWFALARAREHRAAKLEAVLVPTAKNAPCKAFFESRAPTRDGDRFEWDATAHLEPPRAVHIAVEGA